MAFFPDDALERIRLSRAHNRLAHAYLATSPDPSTNESFAFAFASLLLAASKEKIHSHPDFYEIRPESKLRRILIEQIRDLQLHLFQTPVSANVKMAIVHDADRLNEAAANAFLKTLEEPPENTHILLTSTLPNAILPTILSRCVSVPLRPTHRHLTPRELAARQIALELLDLSSPNTIEKIFLAARKFLDLLAEIRDAEEAHAEQILKSEKSRLRETTDIGQKWFDELEAKLAATASAHTLIERSRLLDAFISVFAEKLTSLASGSSHSSRQARAVLLRKLDSLRNLRSALDRGANEPLAIESYFLEIFLEP